MRSEGHYAVVLDDVVGFFYGPLFVNGFRVLVSEEAVEEEEPPPVEPYQNFFLDAVRIVFAAFAATGLLLAALGFAYVILMSLRALAQDIRNISGIIPLLMCLLPFMALLVFFVILGPLMTGMNRLLRDESSVIGWLFRGMAIAWVLLNLLSLICTMAMIAWWFVHGSADGGLFQR